ncbi:MAG: hypothetical protein Q9169_008578, partial [Polycauliona sp. 2 TL-2023]
YPPDSLSEPWPEIRGYNFSLSADALPYPARNIPDSDLLYLTVKVLANVHKHIETHGNDVIPNDISIVGPIEVMHRSIMFEICSLAAASATQFIADPEGEDDGLLRWEDLKPILATFRFKMQREHVFRERAAWITHKWSNVRLGAAKIVYSTPGYEDGAPVLAGRCD